MAGARGAGAVPVDPAAVAALAAAPLPAHEVLRDDTVLLKGLRAQSLDRDEVLEATGWSEGRLAEVEKALLRFEVEYERSLSTAERYADFVTAQRSVVRELDGIVASSRNDMARIGALRLKSEIIEKTLTTGQRMGVIEEKARELRVVGGVTVSAMSREALEELLQSKRRERTALLAPRPQSRMAAAEDTVDAEFEELL